MFPMSLPPLLLSTQGQWTPLHLAARYGKTEVAALLVQGGADLNARSTVSGSRLRWGVIMRFCDIVIL